MTQPASWDRDLQIFGALWKLYCRSNQGFPTKVSISTFQNVIYNNSGEGLWVEGWIVLRGGAIFCFKKLRQFWYSIDLTTNPSILYFSYDEDPDNILKHFHLMTLLQWFRSGHSFLLPWFFLVQPTVLPLAIPFVFPSTFYIVLGVNLILLP